MRHYDIILAGGGAAGLSLAYHLSQSALRETSILIIDREVKRHNDHTWCSWLRSPEPFDEIAYRTWDQLAFIGPDLERGFEKVFDLAPYRYRMVRGFDFYRFTRETLHAAPAVDFLLGEVERVVDALDHAEVHVNAQVCTADWVFDSRYDPANYRPLTGRYHYLIQHFLGWEIETPIPAFDPHVPRMFDFRTPQHNAMRFVYVLPYDPHRALVEYTLFSPALLPQTEYEAALRGYLADVLGLTDYHIVDEEQALIPMTEHPCARRAGRRVMNIGTRGGRVKASTGYAFHRIQQDSAAIVASLRRHGHPFDVPTPPRRYRLFDAILLEVLAARGDLGAPLFTTLFQNNPIQRIFRFLDEEDGLGGNLQLLASLPPGPFIAAWLRLARRRYSRRDMR
jgi:lycopene beta-cyclase